MCLPLALFAQEDGDPEIDDWEDYTTDLYSMGDQSVVISLGVGFPLGFWNNGEKLESKIEPPIGGTGVLTYNYYLNHFFFLGGDLGLLFLPTIADHTVFLTTLGAKAGAQLVFGRFEFPAFITLGMTIQTYLDFGYFGMFAKAGVSAFFRITHEWSFGFTSHYSWYPQWTNEPAKNVDGHFADIMISGRYHF